MRRVADRFGVEAMALYNYFPSRELLLDGVVERVVDDLYNDPRVEMNTDNWQEFLSRVAHGVRRTALAHPLLFPLIATRGSAAPRGVAAAAELAVDGRVPGNLSPLRARRAASLQADREFSSFLLGHLLLEIFPHRSDSTPPEPLLTRTWPPTLVGHPRLHGLRTELTQDHFTEDFSHSLHDVIGRIDLLERRSPAGNG